MSEFTHEKIQRMRELYAGGLANQVELANMFGVSPAAISQIVRGKTYAAAPGPIVESQGSPRDRRRLTDDQARELIEMYDSTNHGTRPLADSVGLARSAVQRIVQRRTYRDVTDD